MTGHLGLLTERELGQAVRARWFIAYLVTFLAGGAALAAFGLGDTMVYGYRGFAKAIVGLTHLSLLFVPLLAVIPAVAALADERETGALEYLLAQPVTFAEVYLGKWIGVAAAVGLAVVVGFGGAGALAAARGVPFTVVGTMLLYVILLALVFVGLGIAFAGSAPSRARATTGALIVWLVFVALGTLGVMAGFVRWGLPASLLIAWTFANPVEAFRLGVVTTLDPDLSILGPVGAEIVASWGTTGTVMLCTVSLLIWAFGPGLIGLAVFRRRRT